MRPPLAALLVLLSADCARAHRLELEARIENGYLRVEAFYEGDIPAQNARVALFDAERATVASGRTDETGVCRLPLPPPGDYGVTADEAGHRARVSLTVPGGPDPPAAVAAPPPGLPRWLALTVGGVLIAASGAALRRMTLGRAGRNR